jgi:hypothetical protein
VNFFTLYDLEHICGTPPRQTRMGEPGIQKQVRKWVAAGKPHDEWCREPFLALETFVRLQQAYGWKAFEALFAEYRALPKEERPKNDAEKRDQWATRLSRITGQNIAAVFDAWNIPLSDTARQACSKYPRPAAAGLSQTSSDARARDSRLPGFTASRRVIRETRDGWPARPRQPRTRVSTLDVQLTESHARPRAEPRGRAGRKAAEPRPYPAP